MSFVYDLMEWVHPGTIHEYASADQKKLQVSQKKGSAALSSKATTVANAGGASSPLQAGPGTTLDGDEG